jgi:hypothetical protein
MIDPARLSMASRWFAVAALGMGLVLGALVIGPVWRTARFEAWASRDLGGPAPPPWTPAPAAGDCNGHCPAPALAASAVRLAVGSANLATPERRRAALADADRRLTLSLQRQPASGSAWSWLAYVRLLEGRPMDQVCDALARSYAAAPFLAEEGPWRARVAAANWSRLAPSTQDRLVDEAVWLRDVRPEAFSTVAPAFADPAATRALAQGLRRPRPSLVPHRFDGAPGGVGAAK